MQGCHTVGRPADGVVTHTHRAETHAVEGILKPEHQMSSRDLPGQFQRRFDGGGSGRTGELDAIVESAGCEQVPVERLQQCPLGDGAHVERVHHAVVGQIVEQLALDVRVVVPVIDTPGTGEEVQIPIAAFIGEPTAFGPVENHGPGPAVISDGRFVSAENSDPPRIDSCSSRIEDAPPAVHGMLTTAHRTGQRCNSSQTGHSCPSFVPPRRRTCHRTNLPPCCRAPGRHRTARTQSAVDAMLNATTPPQADHGLHRLARRRLLLRVWRGVRR